MFPLIPKKFLLPWIVSIFLLAACAQTEGAVPTSTLEETLSTGELTVTIPPGASHGNEIGGYIELVDMLRAAGATVEPSDTVEQPFFEVSGQMIKVDGADVQVFEFSDETTRETVSSLITPEGQPNPTA